jgi:hypothetical protein
LAFTGLHGFVSQKKELFMTTVVRISNPNLRTLFRNIFVSKENSAREQFRISHEEKHSARFEDHMGVAMRNITGCDVAHSGRSLLTFGSTNQNVLLLLVAILSHSTTMKMEVILFSESILSSRLHEVTSWKIVL